jgi:DNA polymerase-4
VPGPVAHIDLDAFYAAVELQKRPELKGQPVIVAGGGPRAVVTTASYEARAYGVGSAMPASQALRLCPQAKVIVPDFAGYKKVSGQVMEIIHSHIPRVEQLGLDEAYLDLSGLLSPKSAVRRVVAEIRTETGMSASVGIGPNRLVAKVASDAEKPAGFVVLDRREAFLRFRGESPRMIPGIGPKTVEKLEGLSVRTIDQLARCEPGWLAEHFGPRQGPWLLALSHFEASAEIETDRERVSESREATFDFDIAEAPEMEERLRELASDLAEGLARSGRRGRTVRIKVRLDDWTTVTRARTLPQEVAGAAVISEVAVELLRQYGPARPVRLLGVGVTGFAPAGDRDQLELPVGEEAA